MNPRQRKGVMFLVFAAVGAIAVFFSVVSYVNNVESQVGDRVPAFVFKSDVPAFRAVTPDQLQEVEIPERWIPDGSIGDISQLNGRVTSARMAKGTLLQDSTLVPAPQLEATQREIAILVDAETGVAGKIQSGDRVDVWATFDESITQTGPRTKLIAQELLVIDVGLQVTRQRRGAVGALTDSQAVPITFATSSDEIKALSFAESFATETRLALRPPGDTSLLKPNKRDYVETFGGR